MNRIIAARQPQSTAYGTPIAQRPRPTISPYPELTSVIIARYRLIRWPISPMVRVVRLIWRWPKSWTIRSPRSSRFMSMNRTRMSTKIPTPMNSR